MSTYHHCSSPVPGHVYLVARDIDKNLSCDGNTASAPRVILSPHRKGLQFTGVVANGCQNVTAGSLEVEALAIKRCVVGISDGRAGTVRVRVAAKLTPHHATGLLGFTGAGPAVHYPCPTITGTQVLTFLTIPELLATLPIAPIVVAPTRCGPHAMVAIENKAVVTLAALLAHSLTGEGETKAGAGGGTRPMTRLVVAVTRAGVLWRDTGSKHHFIIRIYTFLLV